MVDYSRLLVEKLVSMGFFNFFIFIIAFTAIYAILKNKKFLGDNILINALLSFSIAFFAFAYPILSGINVVLPLSTFITQAMIIGLVFFLGIIMASLFYPNIIDFLQKTFTSRNILFGMIALSLALFVTSGLVTIIYVGSSGYSYGGGTSPSENRGVNDLSVLIAGLIIVFVILLISSHISRGA
ncbi:MAG: hypothetical protein QXX30_02320 [Candidatus Aenigmatarchaeota archaeon]